MVDLRGGRGNWAINSLTMASRDLSSLGPLVPPCVPCVCEDPGRSARTESASSNAKREARGRGWGGGVGREKSQSPLVATKQRGRGGKAAWTRYRVTCVKDSGTKKVPPCRHTIEKSKGVSLRACDTRPVPGDATDGLWKSRARETQHQHTHAVQQKRSQHYIYTNSTRDPNGNRSPKLIAKICVLRSRLLRSPA